MLQIVASLTIVIYDRISFITQEHQDLINRVDLVEVVEDEVEDGGPGRSGPVELSRLVDFEAGTRFFGINTGSEK
jgi:hypothetical protein